MKSKKVFSRLLGLLIILAISFYSVHCLSEVNNNNTYMEDFSLQSKINKLETELNKIENDELKRISIKITTDKNLTQSEKEKIINEAKMKIREETKKVLLKYGFEPVSSVYSKNEITPYSYSSDIVLTDNLYYDKQSGLYRFQGEWDWVDFHWDYIMDIEDLVAVRFTNPDGYTIYSCYAKTWNELGEQTGYVDNKGMHSPQNSKVTKRFEDLVGVVYNLIDDYTNTGVGPVCYSTDSGRITLYLKKTKGGYSKIFLDFHHNWRTISLAPSASISNVGLNGAGYSLNVSYSHVNKCWQRCSGGQTIN